MSYLTDRELLKRFEYYVMQVESRLLEGEDFDNVAEQVPFGVHLNDMETLEVMYVNENLERISGFHNDEIREMGMSYLENNLHPTTLANVSEYLPRTYREMGSHETFPFIQYVKLRNEPDYSPLITFSKTTSYRPGMVICLSLEPKDFEDLAPKVEKIVEIDRFKLNHFQQFQKLTGREVEVLKLLANGFNNPQIADRLHIARSTVETHRKRVKRKLDLQSFRDLMKYAFAFDLVEC